MGVNTDVILKYEKMTYQAQGMCTPNMNTVSCIYKNVTSINEFTDRHTDKQTEKTDTRTNENQYACHHSKPAV